jgi:hypothetical protein
MQATNKPKANEGAFLSTLHHRIADHVRSSDFRGWLHQHAHLELAERNGWPVLVLVLEAPIPSWHWGDVLQHYRLGAIHGTASGPLADLAKSLELREVGR